MKNQVDAIFDAAGAIIRGINKADAIDRREAEIANCTRKKCGNCEHWLKPACKSIQRRSMGSLACRDFVLSDSSKLAIGSAKEKLAILKQPEGK